MEAITTQRIVCPQLRDHATGQAAARWAQRLPGVRAAGIQRESAELVLTYDLRELTLADIRRHLARGGVSCDASLIQRCHLLAVDRAERHRRALLGVTPVPLKGDLPLVHARAA